MRNGCLKLTSSSGKDKKNHLVAISKEISFVFRFLSLSFHAFFFVFWSRSSIQPVLALMAGDSVLITPVSVSSIVVKAIFTVNVNIIDNPLKFRSTI